MKIFFYSSLLLALLIFSSSEGYSQNKGWSFNDCRNYALEHNVQLQKSLLSIDRNTIQVNQAKSNRFPSVSASVSQNFSWGKSIIETGEEYGGLSGSSRTGVNVSSNVTIFNGFRLQNEVKQSELDFESGKYNTEYVKESVELNILNAFLQVLFAQEQVNNAEKQIEATDQQLFLAKERMDLGSISRSDYLQINSELATEKLTLANSKSQLNMAKVNLMQMMELPVTDDFNIFLPSIESIIEQDISLSAEDIYKVSLNIRPQVKSAELSTESAKLNAEIAKAGLYPSLSVNAGLGTNYTSQNPTAYFDQLGSFISPSLGLSLSIPVFQKNQNKNNISLAKIGIQDAQLEELNTRNNLRKSIEQAFNDVVSARTEYKASLDQNASVNESYLLASERYNQGLINSVDFLIQKTNLISSESKMLQSKYNLVFNYKILDFYRGIPLTLE